MRSSYYKPARAKEKEVRISGIDVVNVRKVPNGEIIGELRNRDRVEVLEEGYIWTKIRYEGSEAFVVSKFLKEGIL